jgi:hypothetical protein
MKKLFLFFTFVVWITGLMTLTLAANAGTGEILHKTEWEKVLEELRTKIKDNGYTYTVDYNPACQYSLEELCKFNSLLGHFSNNGPGTVEKKKPNQNNLPSRYIGYYSSVKHQGACGGAWAIGMAGAVEGLILKTMGSVADISDQWLIDCNPWGWGCMGGFVDYSIFVTEGAPDETCYPYAGQNQPCNTSCPPLYFIYDWDWVTGPYDLPLVEDIKQAIMDYGSVTAGVYANTAFQAYSGGVFNNCTSGSANHLVVLCGWDDSLGGGAWLLKNSWGTGWGGVDIDENGTVDPDEEGFMWITYNCNNVGYAAAYPIPYFGG